MTDKFTPHAFVGSAPINLVGNRPLNERFNPKRRFDVELSGNERADRELYQESRRDLYSDGFAAGVRETKDRLHGNVFFALTVGTLTGTIAGVVYRELGMALAATLGY